ncbi:laminin subunit beta-1-like isoform X2 [Acanthaster planci]|uniref:Laminin subunit beta-1-like isoform X2 n=1 Tax=Acanthaster planci TaxID=133434 RepID=A0A8B7ZLW1_ACAPL|nr:laminin subunit beta-1-like isoform X2 [Acanthaster planci]
MVDRTSNMGSEMRLWTWMVLLVCLTHNYCTVSGQDTPSCQNSACYPPFIDLIQDLPNRTVTVTSTCGTPASDYELRFVGSEGDGYQRQTCNATDPENAHPAAALYDAVTSFFLLRPDLSTWWQSASGDRDVQLTLMLGDRFLFQGTTLVFRSLRPKSLFIEKSNNFGQAWLALQYYAISCSQTFPSVPVVEGAVKYLPICEEKYVVGDSSTEIPNSDIQQVQYNPAQKLGMEFSQEAVMRYFTITNIRITLGLPGSQTVLRNYFAVADWEVNGQCLCFGHAEQCQGEDASECVCQHNTAGRHCDRCLPLFNNKPWRAAVPGPNSANACEECDCNGFASSCVYDAVKGYGVCQNCAENTGGDNCQRCDDNYFRNPYTDPTNNDTCIDLTAPYPCSQYCWPCMCDVNGTQSNTICNETNGSCTCKLNVQNVLCDECKDTFFNLSALNPDGCQPCDCNSVGSLGSTNFCDKVSGQCICKANVEGSRCDTCKTGSYNLDAANPDGCTLCRCGLGASLSGLCNPDTGACACRTNITGRGCNQTFPGYYVPKLDGMTFEAELAIADKDVTMEERPTDTDTARHTGRGFLAVPVLTVVIFSNVTVPRTQAFEVVLRYESTSDFPGVRIELAQLVPTEYECQGTNMSGDPISFVSNIQAAGVGGSLQFGSACLNAASRYNISVVIGSSVSGPSATVLLDSVVLLPVLEDLDVFTSDMTSNLTRQAMRTCWEAAVSARSRVTVNRGECAQYEFAIMAEVYNGAIACSCNDAGTVPGTVCDLHSGQCQCVPGVTSQSCDYCKAYHYGYNTAAGCTPCACDINGAVLQSCNDNTGVCDCHANVVGDKCNACLAEHYGLYTGTGCVPCICAANYSLDNACDDTGQCNCKPGIGGLNCSQCAPGYYQLTTDGCTFCGCDPVGSAQSGCDDAGNCLCREGTMGDKCQVCKEGFYGFGPWSERGCAGCYCSSHSAQCTTASSWFRAQIASSWSLLNSGAVDPRWTGVTGSGAIVELNEVPILDISNPRLILELIAPTNATDFFFASPAIFHGDFRTAYGQSLTFFLSQSTDQGPFVNPAGDVFIDGIYANETLVAALPYAPNTDMNETEYQFKLHENYWRKGSLQGDQPTAEYMIRILTGIQSIRIRAKYNALPGESVFLYSVMLDYATQGDGSITGDSANFVENCTCPAEYMGLFCESCAPGYKRASLDLGPFSDCVPCECNGHSDLPCDPDSGVCQGCRDNTGGEFCQLCLDGYFGNATNGTPGDCQPCRCPGPTGSVNSFAPVCDDNGVCISCAEGHGGDYCQMCVTGYYGMPTDSLTNSGRCVPCSCNLSPGQCNTVTGECLNCTGNTTGHTCDVCDFGFWGTIDNCQACDCDPLGGFGNCSQDIGMCSCYPNVVGDRCTQCAANTWGFASGAGCTSCDCHPVATANQQTQCNLLTGQCECKPRVTGQKCDQCQQGYWNLDQECIPCQCNLEGTALDTCTDSGNCTCDLLTGQCSCKMETIAGRTCNRCGRIEEGAFPNCEPCPECFQNWRQVFENMATLFREQHRTVRGLLDNYGNLTVPEVDYMLDFIRRNLSSAAVAIEVGTREIVDLEYIQVGFQQISDEVDNFTDLVTAIESNRLEQASRLGTVRLFAGSVVVGDGAVRNAQQLRQDLNALSSTQATQFQLGNGTWMDIQDMYTAIEVSEQHIQQLLQDVNRLLQDTELAAAERLQATQILNDGNRGVEYNQNSARLAQISAVQQAYPLASTAQNASAARQVALEVNGTMQGILDGVVSVRGQADAQAYRSEVARFNVTNAEDAARQAQSAAMSYKDIALSTKANMTSLYIQAIDTLVALRDAQARSEEARAIAQAIQNMTVRPSTEMGQLVSQINVASLTTSVVENLLQDATDKFGRAEQTRVSAASAQQEAESVGAQLQTIEYELTEAERVRTETTQRLMETDNNITSISSTASQVQQQANEALASGQQTSVAISTLLGGVRSTAQCFSARRNQAEDAANRASLAGTQASTAQQTYESSAEHTAALVPQIAAAKAQSSSNLSQVQAVADDAERLQGDLVTVQQMADLDALMTQYMTQRQQMEELSAKLEGLETSLDAILTNLDGAAGGTLQCN